MLVMLLLVAQLLSLLHARSLRYRRHSFLTLPISTNLARGSVLRLVVAAPPSPAAPAVLLANIRLVLRVVLPHLVAWILLVRSLCRHYRRLVEARLTSVTLSLMFRRRRAAGLGAPPATLHFVPKTSLDDLLLSLERHQQQELFLQYHILRRHCGQPTTQLPLP